MSWRAQRNLRERMAATMVPDSLNPSQPRVDAGPATLDLDSTTDLHDESTSDLDPTTLDVADAEHVSPAVADPPLASATFDTPAALDEHAADAGGPLAPGMILLSRWVIESVLGAGGASIVYRARDLHSGAQNPVRAALKTPRPDQDRERGVQRLTYEFEHARALTHPHIVKVVELQTAHADEAPFMIMELIDGPSLAQVLRDRRPPPLPLTRKVLKQSAEALAYAHGQGVIHGDFKPSNLLLTREEHVKVVDFGAAVAPGGQTRIAAGTPAYASPEVLSGATPDVRDDVFSFACVAYELLTGRHPFERRSSLQARNEGRIPPRAWTLSAAQWLALLAALSWDRDQRPENVAALADALCSEQAAEATTEADAPQTAHSAELPEEFMPASRSWGFFVFLACAAGVIYLTLKGPSEHAGPAVTLAAPAAADVPATLLTGPAASAVMGAPVSSSMVPSVFSAPPLSSQADDGALAPVKQKPVATEPKSKPAAASSSRNKPAAAPARSQISFEQSHIVTSEKSVAAVFVLKRSPPLSGRARVQWKAESGTAKAGADFARDAGGAVEFADGQAQRAIFVPLAKNARTEGDRTFTIRLTGAHNAALGDIRRSTAMIRDGGPD